MSLSAGMRLGSYEILSALGAGGMGEVYRARDLKLAREVAIKVLPELFAADADRLARFQREAQLLASLNHPNIAHIHGIEDFGGARALVLELVEGETLAERIACGALPIEDALAVARQITDALEAAHEKGIVHRDLKPANVKLARDGQVKVLDFGLAKAMTGDAGSAEVSHSPTLTARATQAGVVLGTAAYMSPEQARGKPVDRRTDVWAFGCVLFEMLTRRRAFEGETVSDTLAAVLTREPEWQTLPAATPASVRRLLRHCLDRDPKRRLHDIADARIEIDEAAGEPGAVALDARPFAKRETLGWRPFVTTAVVAAGLAALLTWRLVGRAPQGRVPVVAKLARLTRDPGRSEWPSWSPDASLLAYASNRSGNAEIYLRQGEGDQDVNVTNDPAEDIQPAFSPNGETIAFVSTRSSRTGLIRIGGVYTQNVRTYGGDLWVVPAFGGAARRIALDANFPTWRPDGKAILYVSGPENRRSILEVAEGGGAPRVILDSEASSWEISRIGCSPNGRWISFETQLEGLFLMPASGGAPHEFTTGFGHAWDASSQRLHFIVREPQGGTRIQMVGVTPQGQAAAGAPMTLSLMTTAFLHLAVSRDGLHIAVPEGEASRNLTRLPLAPGGAAPAAPEERLTSGRVTDSYPSVSPDGGRVAYVSDVLGHMEVAVLEIGTRRRELLQLPGEDVAQVSPVWMPDGKQLLISRSISGTSANWIVAVDGSRAEQLFVRKGQRAWSLNPSPDGRRLLYGDKIHGVQEVLAFDLDTRKAKQLTDSPGDKFDSVFSPDGKWIAVTGIKDGAVQLFRMSASGGPLQQLTTGYERMRHPFFSPDGKWIYIQPSHRNIYRVRAEGGPLEAVTRYPEAGLFLEEPTLSPDGRMLYYCRENGGASLWLLTLEERGRQE